MLAAAVVSLTGLAIFAGQTQTAAAKPSAGSLVGTGATFPFPLISKWIPAVDNALGINITYTATGSGAGIAQITARTVDFGASDAPLSPDQLTACKGCVVIPWALAGMSVMYNLPGIGGRLKLNGPVLANIYLGTITNWNAGRHQGAQSGHEPAGQEDHRRLSLGRVGLDVRVHELPRNREPAVEEQGRREHDRQLPDRDGRSR